MKFELEIEKQITVRPADVLFFKEVEIEKILDDVIEKKIIVWIKNMPHPIELSSLSDGFYDDPEWTNESLQLAVKNFFNSIA